jgi:hypothetical protein
MPHQVHLDVLITRVRLVAEEVSVRIEFEIRQNLLNGGIICIGHHAIITHVLIAVVALVG